MPSFNINIPNNTGLQTKYINKNENLHKDPSKVVLMNEFLKRFLIIKMMVSCDKVKYFPQLVADQEILEFPWSDAGDIYQ